MLVRERAVQNRIQDTLPQPPLIDMSAIGSESISLASSLAEFRARCNPLLRQPLCHAADRRRTTTGDLRRTTSWLCRSPSGALEARLRINSPRKWPRFSTTLLAPKESGRASPPLHYGELADTGWSDLQRRAIDELGADTIPNLAALGEEGRGVYLPAQLQAVSFPLSAGGPLRCASLLGLRNELAELAERWELPAR